MSDLKNRERVNFTVDKDLMIKLRSRSQSSGVPMSKMIDRALSKTYFERSSQKSIAEQIDELRQAIESWSDDERRDANKVLTAVEKIFDENYSDGEGDSIINELLENDLKYDGKDYSDYLGDKELLKFCDKALVLRNAWDVVTISKELDELL